MGYIPPNPPNHKPNMSFARSINAFFKRYSKVPWCEYDTVNGQLSNVAYNSAFIAEVRESLKDTLSVGTFKTDQEVIDLWQARRSFEAEQPNLEVVHSGIDEDGKLQLKLSWNNAFIRMLKQHGFDAEDEDTIIQAYLASIARENADELPPQQSEALPDAAPAPSRIIAANNIADALDDLDPDTVREIERELRSRAQRRAVKRKSK